MHACTHHHHDGMHARHIHSERAPLIAHARKELAAHGSIWLHPQMCTMHASHRTPRWRTHLQSDIHPCPCTLKAVQARVVAETPAWRPRAHGMAAPVDMPVDQSVRGGSGGTHRSSRDRSVCKRNAGWAGQHTHAREVLEGSGALGKRSRHICRICRIYMPFSGRCQHACMHACPRTAAAEPTFAQHADDDA